MGQHSEMRRLSVNSNPEALTLVRTWRNKYTLWPVLLASAAIFIFAGAFGVTVPLHTDIVGIAGRVVIGGLAIFGGYWALTSAFNRTIVTVAAGGVSVRHGPLPIPGLATLEAAALGEVKVRFVRQARTDGPTYYTYELVAHLADGSEAVLFVDRDMALTERAQAEIAGYLTGN